MGPYCQYCDHRCFLPRRIPGGPRGATEILMATCAAGMERDRQETGYDHTTAINPVTGEPGGKR